MFKVTKYTCANQEMQLLLSMTDIHYVFRSSLLVPLHSCLWFPEDFPAELIKILSDLALVIVNAVKSTEPRWCTTESLKIRQLHYYDTKNKNKEVD